MAIREQVQRDPRGSEPAHEEAGTDSA